MREAQALTDQALLVRLDELTAEVARVAALQAQTIREVESRGIPAAQGVTGMVRWLQERYRLSPREARRLVELGRLLERRQVLASALASGTVSVEQAETIGGAVEQLSGEPEVSAAAVAEAETALVVHAATCPPKALQGLGWRILAYVAPDVADRVDAAILARQEARGRAARTFQLTSMGDGRVRCTGWLDVEGAAVVKAALDPLSGLRRTRASTDARDLTVTAPSVDDRTPGQRRADALVDVCRLALSTGELPVHGGDRPQLVVTVPYDVLRKELDAGQLDGGEQLSPAQVRQLACDAQILPAVLGGDSQVLDYGRSRRLVTGPLRRALILRDRGCVWPGCPIPARYCEAHHLKPWYRGGTTILTNLALLCHAHHRLAERQRWTIRIAADGHPELIAPQWLDPNGRPRRNLYHRRC